MFDESPMWPLPFIFYFSLTLCVCVCVLFWADVPLFVNQSLWDAG